MTVGDGSLATVTQTGCFHGINTLLDNALGNFVVPYGELGLAAFELRWLCVAAILLADRCPSRMQPRRPPPLRSSRRPHHRTQWLTCWGSAAPTAARRHPRRFHWCTPPLPPLLQDLCCI